jgi:transcriptional regulator with XRE-family HTH domain
MGTDLATWQRWEEGQARPPLDLLIEFAHRFGAGLDFLYRGQLTGIAPEIWRAILAAHPELNEPSEAADPTPELRAMRRNRKARGDGKDDPRERVSGPKLEKK